MASVIASGTRIWPGFSKPSVISCTLRLQVRAGDNETRGELMCRLPVTFLHVCNAREISILLPELHHRTGEVGRVCDGVVCVAFVRVPWIVT